MRLHSLQDKAVADYLIEHGEINRDFAYDHGLPACGRIKNLGGRIHELRKGGWDIKTDVRSGVYYYVLIAVPKQQQLTLV
jgi:Helix-turn-helix domain